MNGWNASSDEQRPVQRVTRSKLQARRWYDRLSPWYDLLEGRWEHPAIGQALDLLAVEPGEQVLEIGPGTGWALIRMAEEVGPAGRVFAVDLSPRMAAATRDRLADAGLGDRAQVSVGDACRLPFPDSRFDAVFMSFFLELMDSPDIPVVLGECRRCLRPGGRLAVASLSRKGGGVARWLYERGHDLFPSVLDCRPIDVEASVANAGFLVREARLISIERLPVELVLARRPGHDPRR